MIPISPIGITLVPDEVNVPSITITNTAEFVLFDVFSCQLLNKLFLGGFGGWKGLALDRKKLALCIIACVAAVGAAAFLGSRFVDTQSEWYTSLAKPAFTPPPVVFSIAWGVVYLCLAASAVLVCNKSYRLRELTLYVYGLNLVLNVLWTYVFFQNQNPAMALVVLVLLLGTVAAMADLSARLDKVAAILLIPYLLWGTFALVLNYVIIMMN